MKNENITTENNLETENETTATQEKQVLRFTRLNRGLHFFMILSFLNLALSGMTLKFSYTGWARFLSSLYGGFESAGYLHRFSALVMVTVFIIHIVDLIKNKRKEAGSLKALIIGPRSMMFNKKDLNDFIGSMKWFLGKGERPEYGRWTYWEKFDYFAVFWGMIVIGSTGFVLWFPEFFTLFIPGFMINVATIIHSDEALLATGFIFTIHFFNTHLRPEKFPMDVSIFTGRVPLEEFKLDRPKEYEEIMSKGVLNKYLIEAYPPIVLKVIKLFGWTVLIIGFSMIIWIIYAMIFAYR
jgi:cytochrome b subunit of formate dehydrogenase